jgi:hypothetical protein
MSKGSGVGSTYERTERAELLPELNTEPAKLLPELNALKGWAQRESNERCEEEQEKEAAMAMKGESAEL